MFDEEQAPRIPDGNVDISLVSRAMDYWCSDFYRRRNTCESLCPPVKLAGFPDAFEQWQIERKSLLSKFEEYIYGKIPPPPDLLETEVLAEHDNALDGLAVAKEIRIYCRMHDGRCHDFDMLLYLPKNSGKAVPVFVGLNFDGNQANTPDEFIRLTRGPAVVPGQWWRTGVTEESKRNQKLDIWNFAEAVKRGYAVATANYGEIFPDNPCGYEKSIYRLFRNAEELTAFPEPPAPLRDFGAISAWAWGLSRMLDVLEKIPQIDADKAAVIGHSRLGKTALWAGANDERFKLVISNNSGCLGAALSCRDFGEKVGHLAYINRFWFVESLMQFAYCEDAMPVDQHQLLALIAPRALYVASSNQDHGADPRGEFMSIKAASEVWKLYGESVDLPPELPATGSGTAGSTLVGYHIKQGNHSITAGDWMLYYDFADRLWQRANN